LLPGTVTFIIGFTGCVGALRENTCLLAAVSISSKALAFCSNFRKQKPLNKRAPFVGSKGINLMTEDCDFLDCDTRHPYGLIPTVRNMLLPSSRLKSGIGI
jgi:hypothetical protein